MMMNLTELFEVQRKLDAEIERKHPTAPGEDRLAKRILALQVELGELANEWRGFKFWSLNQKPNDSNLCSHCGGNGHIRYEEVGHILIPVNNHSPCESCDGFGYKNPLLEEYVDCLHFALSIGNEYRDRHEKWRSPVDYLEIHEYKEILDEDVTKQDITIQFIGIYSFIGLLSDKTIEPYPVSYAVSACSNIINNLLGLGEMLGFTWEQIETAYMSKNKTNWERQANGY